MNNIPKIQKRIQYLHNEKAYKQEGQYFWGNAFLSAPITAAGTGADKMAKKDVRFPDGVWYIFFDNTKYEGYQTISASADIYEFPLFAKGGCLYQCRSIQSV